MFTVVESDGELKFSLVCILKSFIIKTNRVIGNMKNKLRFAGFLISRFRGLFIDAIGIGTLIFSVIREIYVPDAFLFYGINFYIAVLGFVLLVFGEGIRTHSKNPLFHLTKTDTTLVIAGFVVFIFLTSLRLVNTINDTFLYGLIFLDITVVLIAKRTMSLNKTKTIPSQTKINS